MTSFNERAILYVLLLAAAGLGLIGLTFYWIWQWLSFPD